jgi:hypothetical protein
MSALGQKRTSHQVRVMSALPPKADIDPQSVNVRFVPKADNALVFGPRADDAEPITPQYLPSGWSEPR